jgi:ParB family chromosome partitioning protein
MEQAQQVVVQHARSGDNVEGMQAYLRASQIRKSRYQPREYFDANEMMELKESIKSLGLIQPIVVFEVEGEESVFELIGGERRWRAMTELYGNDVEIPVLIKDVPTEVAEAMALSENIQRAQMSPAEEAAGASRLLGELKGDRDETARKMGWSRATLDKRLALMNCSANVRSALTFRKIDLGHAELLAAVPQEQQDKVLEQMQKLAALPTVAQLKSMLEAVSKPLEKAIFDKTACTSCHHNSENQKALFGESISTGNCTNGSCYEDKTEVELQSRAEAMKSDWPTIRIVRVGENALYVKLVSEGSTGVGEEQAKACRGCANYGVAISAVPGLVGATQEGTCFDTDCNQKMVLARIKADKAAKAAPPNAPSAPGIKNSGNAAAKAPNGGKGKGKGKGEAAASVSVSQRIKDYREKVWRTVVQTELLSSPSKSLDVLMSLALTSQIRSVSSSSMRKLLEPHAITVDSHNVGACASEVATMDKEVRQELLYGIAAQAFSDIEIGQVKSVLKYLDADLGKHWKLNAEYLDLLTKSEIEALADEINLSAALGDQLKKLLGGKKDELIKGLLAAPGFVYEGVVPSAMHWDSK